MTRLDLIASYTKGSKIVCDIGCDHAYALIDAINKYGVEKGIAADINEGPLNNAIKSIKSNNLEEKIKAILSNGFDSILDDFDTAIISGMGGKLICEILNNGLSKINGKKLILEANCDMPDVRRFLFNNGFIITTEEALYDQNKYYEILVAEPGVSNFDEFDILYGPLLRKIKNEAFIKHYNDQIELLENAIPKMNDKNIQREKMHKLFEISYILSGKQTNKYYLKDGINFYRTYFIDDMPRPTIIVAPGGGYLYTSPRESEPVVIEFNKRGYHVVVINYRETLNAYPEPGNNLKEAIEQVCNDSRISKIIGLGFSAGGHAIMELALHKDKYCLNANFDLMMLGYPVITGNPEYAHMGSYKNLLLENENNPELREYLSLETQVTNDNAVDLFLWGTYTDESVPVHNSLLLLDAYKKAKGNVEYHMFPMGGHGLSVCNEMCVEPNTYISRWVDMATEWINNKLK